MTLPPKPPVPPSGSYPSVPDPEQAWQRLVDYLADELPPTERHRLEQRLTTDAAFAAFAAPVMQLWRTPLPVPPRDADAGWAAIQRQAALLRAGDPHPPATPRVSIPLSIPRRVSSARHGWHPSRHWLTFIGVTLLLVLIGRPVFLAYRYPIHYYRSHTTAATFQLPDGSRVVLAPGSYLGTERGFLTRNRTVYLFGHAHFAVALNPRLPFVVTVPGVGARVLGTTFSMHADTLPVVQIAVTQGKVALETRDAAGHWHAVQVLSAGDAAQIPRLEAWLTQAGYALSAAGVPFSEARHLGTALRTAVIHTGAAAARAETHTTPP